MHSAYRDIRTLPNLRAAPNCNVLIEDINYSHREPNGVEFLLSCCVPRCSRMVKITEFISADKGIGIGMVQAHTHTHTPQGVAYPPYICSSDI